MDPILFQLAELPEMQTRRPVASLFIDQRFDWASIGDAHAHAQFDFAFCTLNCGGVCVCVCVCVVKSDVLF